VPRGTRPTTDRLRESLFNRLGQDLGGKRVLDLFAGAGTLGLEALSRSARSVTFVEKSAAAIAAIRGSVASLGFAPERAAFSRKDAFRWLESDAAPEYDVIFADPPYDMARRKGSWERLLRLIRGACAGSGSVVYCESGAALAPRPEHWATIHSGARGSARWILASPLPGPAQ